MTTVYTARIGYGGKGVDITVKSAGQEGRILAPVWSMVVGHKKGYLTDEQYTAQYLDLLRARYRASDEGFLWFLIPRSVTLLCYCQPHAFCHRYLAVDVLEKIATAKGIEFIRGGEMYAMHVR